jgi:hypothetical protein
MRKDRTILLTGLLAGLAVGAGMALGAFRAVPFLSQLLAPGSRVVWIAAAVLWFSLWVLLALAWRHRRAGRELRGLRWAEIAAGDLAAWQLGDGLDAHLRALIWRKTPSGREKAADAAYQGSRLAGRLRVVQGRLADHNRSERLSFLTAGLSGLEAATSESLFGFLRALVWAMPGLGFMGTAVEMAGAVGGIGSSLGGTDDYAALRDLLAEDVIPHLAEAFHITLFALGASVVCFLALALVHRREEEVLNATDRVFLGLLSRLEDERPAPVPGGGGKTTLEDEIRQLRTGLTVAGSELSKLNEFIRRGSAAVRGLFGEPS